MIASDPPTSRMPLNDDPLDTDAAADRPSKTAQKKAMHELQALGEALMTLPDDRIDAIGLDESLREAVRTAQRTRSFEGRRRQMQYLGKLMRKADAEPIREAVAAFQLGHAKDALALHEAERWRAELIADDAALTRWLAQHPDGDAQQLRSLVRSARKDAAAGGAGLPGAAVRQGRAHRELFRLLRAALNGPAGGPGEDEDEPND